MEVDNFKPQVVLVVFPVGLGQFLRVFVLASGRLLCCSWSVNAQLFVLCERFADRARAGDTSHVEKVPQHCQLMD